MDRISFELASNRARYSHMIEEDGTCVEIDSIDTIRDARVGIFAKEPSDTVLSRAFSIAHMATAHNPMVEITFGPGCSPFFASVIERQFTLLPT